MDDAMLEIDEINQRKQRRGRRQVARRIFFAVWALLFAAVVYIGVQVVLVTTPNIRREVAILDTMTDSVTAQGFVALESERVNYTGDGILYYTIASGERVSAGTPVAEVYANSAAAQARDMLDTLDAEIDRIETAMRSSALTGDTENYLRQLQTNMYSLLDAVDGGDYTSLTAPLGEVALSYNKLLLATGVQTDLQGRLDALRAQRAGYQEQAVPVDYVTAPVSGFFVQASGTDRVPMVYDTLAEASVQDLQEFTQRTPEYYGAEVAGYIISDYKWHFFALVDAQDIGRFVEGDKSLTITFAELGSSTLPVTVQSIAYNEGDEYAKVQLYCEYMNTEILKMQNQSVEIIFSTQKGVRISIDALRVVDGEYGVYIVFGNVVYFRKVDILLQDEYYFLVPATTDHTINEVKLYDEVIVDSGGVELAPGKIL